MDGKVKLPLFLEQFGFLGTLLTVGSGRRSAKFLENIRIYNSKFSFTSTGRRVGAKINDDMDLTFIHSMGKIIIR